MDSNFISELYLDNRPSDDSRTEGQQEDDFVEEKRANDLVDNLVQLATLVTTIVSSFGAEGGKAAAALVQCLVSHPNLDIDDLIGTVSSSSLDDVPLYCNISKIYKICKLMVHKVDIPGLTKSLIYDSVGNFLFTTLDGEKAFCQALNLELMKRTGSTLILRNSHYVEPRPVNVMDCSYSPEGLKSAHETASAEAYQVDAYQFRTDNPVRTDVICQAFTYIGKPMSIMAPMANPAEIPTSFVRSDGKTVRLIKAYINTHSLIMSEDFENFSGDVNNSQLLRDFISALPDQISIDTVNARAAALVTKIPANGPHFMSALYDNAAAPGPSSVLEPHKLIIAQGIFDAADDPPELVREYIKGLFYATRNNANHAYSNKSRQAVPGYIISPQNQKTLFGGICSFVGLSKVPIPVTNVIDHFKSEVSGQIMPDQKVMGPSVALLRILIARADHFVVYETQGTFFISTK